MMSVDFLPFRARLNAQSGRKSTLDLYADDAAHEVNLQLLEHSGAAVEHVAVGGIEITGVPGIGHVTGAISPIEQARNLAVGVVAKDATQTACVLSIHIDNVIPVAILRATHLAGTVRNDGNPDFAQLGDRAMMRRVADLLGRSRGGIDDKLARAPSAAHELGKHRLSHRRATDVAVTDKQYALHMRFPFI